MISKKVSRFFSVLFILAVSFSFTSIASAEPLQVVARTGQPAVDAPGFTYATLFNPNFQQGIETPRLVGSQVAFFSTLAQGASMPPTDRALWLVNQSGVGRMVARHGNPAPETESGTTFDLHDDNYNDTIYPFFIDTSFGRVFLSSSLSGPSINSNNWQGLWEIDSSNTGLVTRTGTIVPGTTPHGYIRSFFWAKALDGTAGADLAFRSYISSLYGEPVTLPYTQGVLTRTGSHFDLVFWNFGNPNGVEEDLSITTGTENIGASGRGTFFAQMEGPSIQTIDLNGTMVTNNLGLWRTGPGYQELIARTASPAPGIPGAYFWNIPNEMSIPAVNSSGDIIFWTRLIGTGVSSSNADALWKSTASGVSLLVRSNDPAPEAGEGVRFSIYASNATDGSLWFLNNGNIYFSPFFQGAGVTLSNLKGIYKFSADGTRTLIARSFTPNPALPVGVMFVRTGLPLKMKALGTDHFMFTAKVGGTGITFNVNDQVLMRHTSANGLRLIAQQGQEIDGYILKSFVGDGADLQLTDNYYAVVSATFSPASNPTATPQTGILGISPDGTPHVLAVKNYPILLSDGTSPVIRDLRMQTEDAINDNGDVVFLVKFEPILSPPDHAVLVARISGDTPPVCQADFDHNGIADVADIFAFLSAWFAQNISADTNGNGTVAVDDIFAFLSLWFSGC